MDNSKDYTDELIESLMPSQELQDKIDYQMGLAAKIYLAVKNRDLNKEQFAKLMNTNVSNISRWLSGTHNFDADTLFDIQKKLGITLLAI